MTREKIRTAGELTSEARAQMFFELLAILLRVRSGRSPNYRNLTIPRIH